MSPDITQSLRALSRSEGATLFMTLLAGFDTLLHRHSGETDLVVGVPVAGRNLPEVEGLIGFFVNNLALRVDLSGDPAFRELIDRVRDVTLDAQTHQELPFEKLVEELRPERDTGRSPIFQVVLSMQNTPPMRGEMPAVAVSPLELDSATAQYDLMLSVLEGQDLGGYLEYSTDLFDPLAAARLVEHLQTLLAGAAADPDRRLSELPLLAEAERWQLLGEWNDTAEPVPPACFHEVWAERAALWPDAVAAACGDERLTYGELDRRANRLAHHLRGLGIGPEVPVGLAVERSVEMVVGVLGIWKAGGAYVPLDPAYPEERLAVMLEETALLVIVTQDRLLPRLPRFFGFTVSLDGEHDTFDAYPDEAPDSGVLPENLAYVIFTSGSTGRPKGTLLPHAGLLHLARAHERLFATGPGENLLLFAPLVFDASVFDLVMALARGNTFHLAPQDQILPGPSLLRLLTEREISSLTITPSALAALPETPLPALRRLWVAGEACTPDLVERWALGRRFFNAYGPTEATVWVTVEEVVVADSIPPIGRPVVNRRVQVLDERLQPVPAGGVGELYAGGAGLARGYLGRPDLTAERFVPDPFQPDAPGARLYRTGDLVRRLPDGRLEFAGRRDGQVKVRGIRIELGEVEAALAGVSCVREAAVVAHGEGEDRRLAAFVVVDGTAVSLEGLPPLTSAEMREALRERLPEAMVPSSFTVLPALPLTANDKLDRRVLADLAARGTVSESAGGSEAAAPRTPAEELAVRVLAEVLGVERVGLRDSFFDLGGHSLLATQILSRVREAFGVEVSLTDFFAVPTAEGLAACCEVALRSGDGAVPEAPPLRPAPRDSSLPLSFAQQRLWFLNQLDPESAAYNIPGGLRLSGELDVPALAGSLGEILRRHEVLRTAFPTVDGRPVLAVEPWRPLALPVVDLAALPEPAREAEAGRLGTAAALQPFDLGRGPLVRLLLLRLDPSEHALLFTMHHVVADGWSMGVLVRELMRLYPALLGGGPSPLPELPVQYADFASWQRGWLDGEALESRLAYWRRRLAGAPSMLDLPADRPRPATSTSRGGWVPLHVEARIAAELQALSRRQGATLFMTLLAAFQVLLVRLAGQDDVCVGTPIAGRNRMETEGLIGFFVNTLVLRGELREEDLTFERSLAQARQMALGAYAHQDVPFERLVEELRPERALSHSPLFQVMFALQNAPGEALELPGLTLGSIGVERGTTIFDLTLDITEAPDGLRGGVEHSADLFDAVTVERWIAGFNALLAGVCADPSTAVWDLPLLAEPERRQILEWGTGPAGLPGETSLHGLFQEQAERTPEAVALIDGELRLTYRELAARAGRLAGWLRAAGVVPEERVGLCARRSAGMVAGLLAVLEAGGAYVPLDPNHPQTRLGRILADARPLALIVESGLEDVLPDHGLPVIGLDPGAGGPMRGGPGVEPNNLAYLIYTSGSTGDPKGVAIRHRSAVSMVRWAWDVFPDEDLAGVLFSTSIGFDLSVFELFVPLSRGGTVVLAADALALSSLPALPAANEVTLLNTVPSAMTGLLRLGGLPPSLRTVNLAGEPLTRELASRIHELPQVERLFNLYGPSEDTTYSTFARIGGGEETPAIGRPVSGTRVRVLDRRFRPVLPGVPGELCLGGVGLARGYFGRPDLTAERWVPDAFSDRPGERLYRTGDLVRWAPDGNLQFLGRIDHQVKVRGYRIELGEIEAALAAVAGVREAVVVTRSEGESRTLVACVVAATELSPVSLREALRERLPEPMVPAAFLAFDSLPLTSTGKVDRRALSRLAAETETDRSEPLDAGARTPAEEMLAAIWGEVLGLDRVGPEESFFDLGGHSLLATQVLSRIRTAFGVELPLRRMFETPTVAGLARQVEAALRGAAGLQEPPLLPVPRDGEGLPLSFAQERLWFIDQLQPGTATYNMVTAAHLEGDLDAGALVRSLDAIVARHEALRTRFPMAGGSPVQVIDPPPAWTLPLVDLSSLPADRLDRETRALVDAESVRPFDLAAGPLLRAVLLRRRAATDHVAFLGTHHIVSDGWSMTILVRELTALYAAFSAGAPAPLPALPIQYADFAQWQRSWLQGEVLESQLAFWRERLDGAPAVMALPLDRPRPAVQSFHGASLGSILGGDVIAELRALSRRAGTTLFMTLLAAFDALLHRWTGESDLVVGTPSANRNREEIEGLIGFFVNSLVLRADLSGAPSFRDLLAQVRETTLAAYAHQDLPFEKLVSELRPERDLSHTPVFQVLFQLQNIPASALELPGLSLRFPEVETRTAKFDVTLNLNEYPAGLACEWRYNTGLFDGPTLLRLGHQLETLLRGLVAEPDRPAADLPWLSAPELHQAVVEWNDSALALDIGNEDCCFPKLFDAQAGRTPDAVAVACDGWSLTYDELARRSDRAAGLLAGFGVGPDSVVALLAERGPELLLAILAIQKAGGAWMPLDPAHPEARIAHMIERSGARCIVMGEGVQVDVGAGLAPARVGTSPTPTLKIALADLISAPEGTARPVDRLHPENVAYVIYTSGSTGAPKGVMVEHRGMLNHLRAKVADLGLTPEDVVAQTASHTFDISVWQSFAALLAGGRVQLFRDETAHDPGRLLDGIGREQVTVLQVVPSWLGALCEVLETEAGPALAALRWLFSTGEALSAELCRRWLAVR
ncbi:MAG TPA: amino acid adenylation domain-containing protein, partial [Thermoanaerobaculia bacterium]|nr:amino acid adenylation domain-containing protein [Thermoanaerobaculia bacterium]